MEISALEIFILTTVTGRFMKRLASMEVVLETDVDRYRLTNMSLVLSAPKYASAFPFL